MNNYFVLGGSSGIGKSLVTLLAESGSNVFATYRQHPPESEKANLAYHALDVMQPELKLDFLPDKLHGFVYCPGSINLLPFSRIKPADFVTDYELQVIGAIKAVQGILPRLKAVEQASVVFFSTVAVQSGFNFHSQVAASKGALEGLTRSLAAELSPTIRVNATAPSITDTPLASRLLSSEEKKHTNAQRHPLKKIGSPDNIAEIAAFLLSSKAAWITGQILTIDGGISTLKT